MVRLLVLLFCITVYFTDGTREVFKPCFPELSYTTCGDLLVIKCGFYTVKAFPVSRVKEVTRECH